MTFKGLTSLFLIGLFSLLTISDSDAQRRSSRDRDSSRDRSSRNSDTETISFTDNLAYDIYMGNFVFANGLQLSGKASVGYKVIDRVTAGVGFKFDIRNQNFQGQANDVQSRNLAYFPFVRFKIVESFYAKAEYNFMNFRYEQPNFDPVKVNYSFPMVGAGYLSGFGKWRYGIELLFMLSDSVIADTPFAPSPEKSDLYTGWEWMVAFSYNF